MGFFIRDIHHTEMNNSNAMIVYRGQGIFENELEIIKKNLNGILSFNNYVWTNIDRTISLNLARSSRNNNPNLFGVLFQIEINSMIKLISLENLSYYLNCKNEYLFSIYSLFRINQIKQIQDQIWEINLILINNNDQQIKDYIQSIKYIKGQTAWEKLAFYFIQINQFDKAEELYKILIQLNFINNSKHLALLNEAIQYYKYALHSLPFNHLQISNLYHYIAEIYDQQGIFVDAIQNYQSALEYQLNHFPLHHLSIAKIYNKIGELFYRMEDYTTAFSYYDKTLKIQKKSLSPNHSILAITNYNIAMTLDSLQQYKEAIEYASRAVNIARHSFGSNHKDVQLYEEYLNELREKTLIGVIPNGAVYE